MGDTPDPYARPTGRVARVVDSARYAVGLTMVGAASVIGVGALGLCVAAVMTATLVSPRAARTLMY
jgi:hypothetical protein